MLRDIVGFISFLYLGIVLFFSVRVFSVISMQDKLFDTAVVFCIFTFVTTGYVLYTIFEPLIIKRVNKNG